MEKMIENNEMRELNINEVEEVNGGGACLHVARLMKPTKVGNGEMWEFQPCPIP